MRHALLFVVLLSLPLAGCLTAQERGQQARAQADAFDEKQCLSYGATPGTDAYVNCRSQLMAARVSAPGPVTCTRTGITTVCN